MSMAFTVTCRVCGHSIEVQTWSQEYERLKIYADDPAYVCDPCQEKIRQDAWREQPL